MNPDSENPFESPQSVTADEAQSHATRGPLMLDPVRTSLMLIGLLVPTFAFGEFGKALMTSLLCAAIGALPIIEAPFAWIKTHFSRFLVLLLGVGGYFLFFGLGIWFLGALFSRGLIVVATGFDVDEDNTLMHIAANTFRYFIIAIGGLIVVRSSFVPQDHNTHGENDQ